MLTAKKSEIASKQVERIARELKRNQEKLVDNLDAKKDTLLAKKEKLEMLTVETPQSVLDTWTQNYHEVLVELALIDKEIQYANATLKELFS